MGQIDPIKLLNLIDRNVLDLLDRTVYDGTQKFAALSDILKLSFSTSDAYQLKVEGSLTASNSYFSFTGQQGILMADLLDSLPDELLSTARNANFLDIIADAENKGLQTSIPFKWHNARQMNAGLYDGAVRFGINLPCLRIGFNCEPKDFVRKVEELAGIEKRLKNFYSEIARKP